MGLKKGLFARFVGVSASSRKRKKMISIIIGFIHNPTSLNPKKSEPS
jgi:hypothetical protein